MSVVRYLSYQNRLAKLVNAPGGKTVDAAIADAKTNLQAISAACLIDIDRLIGELIQRAANLSGPVGKDDVLYIGTREIAGLAAICERPCLGEAAHSLCVLIDASESAGRWHREAIAVHVSTLQLLRGMPDEGDGLVPRQVVDSLKDMVKRLAVEETADRAVV